MKIVIERCSNPFCWYADLIKNKPKEETPESIALRTFEVEKVDDTTLGLVYKTTSDVAGPGVKGFIKEGDFNII